MYTKTTMQTKKEKEHHIDIKWHHYMVFTNTFNNMSVIFWRIVLLVGETGDLEKKINLLYTYFIHRQQEYLEVSVTFHYNPCIINTSEWHLNRFNGRLVSQFTYSLLCITLLWNMLAIHGYCLQEYLFLIVFVWQHNNVIFSICCTNIQCIPNFHGVIVVVIPWSLYYLIPKPPPC